MIASRIARRLAVSLQYRSYSIYLGSIRPDIYRERRRKLQKAQTPRSPEEIWQSMMGKRKKGMAGEDGNGNSDSDASAKKSARCKDLPRNVRYKQKVGKLPVPDTISVQVIGTGKKGTPNSVVVNTSFDKYLFNCGEGTQRICTELKVKLLKVGHVFFTRRSWVNIGGFLGSCLYWDGARLPCITLHGPKGVEQLTALSSPFAGFQDLEIEKRDLTEGTFEDESLMVEYVPLHSSEFTPSPETAESENSDDDKSEKFDAHSQTVVAYYCKAIPKLRSVCIDKIVELDLPRNEVIGKLKNGEEVTLPDGRLIKPEQILGDADPTGAFLVLECPDETYLDSLCGNQQLQQAASAMEAPNMVELVIHMTPASVLGTDKYQQWMNSFQAGTKHLILNDDGSELVCEAPYKMQAKLNLVHDSIYQLLPQQIQQPKPKEGKGDTLVYGEGGLQYHLRGARAGNWDRESCFTLNNEEYVDEALTEAEQYASKDVLRKTKESVAEVSKGLDEADRYPEVLFLGTGSSMPNKQRNVTAILLHLSADQCMLLDCGEGTLGQLWRYYDDETPQVLAKLSAVFVSHLHADHHMGLIGVGSARKEAILSQGKEFTPLMVLAPRNFEGWLVSMDNQVVPTKGLFGTFRLESVYWREGVYYTAAGSQKTGFSREVGPSQELGQHSPEEYQSILKLLNMTEFRPVPVYHRQHGHGLVVTHNSGYRLVYSGDTMPCDRLIQAGKDCDLLIHESSFDDELEKEARQKRHSTTSQAIDSGLKMNAAFTLLTHFSQRYATLPLFSERFTDKVGCAFDNMRVRKCDLPLLPLFNSAMRAIFAESYADMEETRFKKQVRSFYEESRQEKKKKKGKDNQPKAQVNPWELVEKQGKGVAEKDSEKTSDAEPTDDDASASAASVDSESGLEKEGEMKVS